MTSKKEQFLTQYVLNRARARKDSFDSVGSARRAIEAWNEIQQKIKVRPE